MRPIPAKLRLGEFFSGPGGMALGAMKAGADHGVEIVHTWAVDYDTHACDTYRANLAKDHPDTVRWADVRDVKTGSLSPIDLFMFGFPCNDFSMVGERKGAHGKFGPLYLEGVRVLRDLKPMFFVAENVSGLVGNHNDATFKTILFELSNLGYKVTPHLYKLEDYGVPQARHRVFVVGVRNDLDVEFRVPAPLDTRVSVRDAVDIGVVWEEGVIPEWAQNNETPKTSAAVIERLKHIKPGENIWEAMLRPDFPKECCIKQTGAAISQIYKRLSPDKPSYTITGSGGGGTHTYHWLEPRPLTNREKARIQTFPDDYVFCGGDGDVRRQIGMAVPPLASKVIIDALLKSVRGIDYASVAASHIDMVPTEKPESVSPPSVIGKNMPEKAEPKERRKAHIAPRVPEVELV